MGKWKSGLRFSEIVFLTLVSSNLFHLFEFENYYNEPD